jgi:MFS family permease
LFVGPIIGEEAPRDKGQAASRLHLGRFAAGLYCSCSYISRPRGKAHSKGTSFTRTGMTTLPRSPPLTALTKVLIATLAAQASIVMASLVLPVLAPAIVRAADIPLYLVGYYSSLIYGFAVLSSLATPVLLARFGGLRLHQGMLVLTAIAVALLVAAHPALLFASALLLGAAYGPTNPASTAMLALHTPAERRARIFSFKQTAVPIGGALAGTALPALAALSGWRGACLVVAAFCGVLALLVQPWRSGLDEHGGATGAARPAAFLAPGLLLQQRPLRAVAFASFAFGATQFSFSALFPTVLSLAGWTAQAAGLVLAMALVISVVCRVPWGEVADRLGSGRVLAVLGALMTACSFAAFGIDRTSSTAFVLIIAAGFGLSAFCWAGIALAETVRRVPPAAISQASAAVIALTFAGALVGPALFSSIALVTGDFHLAFPALGLVSAAATVLLVSAERGAS